MTFAHAVIFAWQIWIICILTSAFMNIFCCKYACVVHLLRRNEDVIKIIVNNLMYSSKSWKYIRQIYQ